MKKIYTVFVIIIPIFLTCSKFPILSDLYNTRMKLILKGTYETNDPYDWNTNVYLDDLGASSYPTNSAITTADPWSNVTMYIDVADLRLAVGSGKPTTATPASYWTYFTTERQVFCSSNTSSFNLALLTCVNNNGDKNYQDLFTTGYTYPAVDVPIIPLDQNGKQRTDISGNPATAYNEMAIFFRKITASPAVQYNSSVDTVGANLTASFDNRVVEGINLMSTIIQFAESDTAQVNTLMFPLDRKDLSLTIPSGNNPYVLEVRIFLKNLLMKHVITNGGTNMPGCSSSTPCTFIGPSDWIINHGGGSQMGGNVIFTARIYDPANIGSITINDNEAFAPPLPSQYKAYSYYAAVPTGSTFTGNDLPYTATGRVINGSGTTGTIKNLPPGNYDIYKTCDNTLLTSAGVSATGNYDGFPETAKLCITNQNVTAGNTTTIAAANITCTCP